MSAAALADQDTPLPAQMSNQFVPFHDEMLTSS
jgi:hypothetical protein